MDPRHLCFNSPSGAAQRKLKAMKDFNKRRVKADSVSSSIWPLRSRWRNHQVQVEIAFVHSQTQSIPDKFLIAFLAASTVYSMSDWRESKCKMGRFSYIEVLFIFFNVGNQCPNVGHNRNVEASWESKRRYFIRRRRARCHLDSV